jgi:hypothetical protein
MNYLKSILSIVLLTILCSCGPKTTTSTDQLVKETETYTSKVDANKSLKETTTEGALTDIDGFKDIGTFKYHVLFDESNNQLYRIKNIEKTDKTITETYYFSKGDLVYVTSVSYNTSKKIYLNNRGKVIHSSNISPEEQKLLLDKAKRFKKAF